jgi:copper chaperone
MLNLRVPDMSCGHCVKSITDAVNALDAQATVDANLDSKAVVINSTVTDDTLIAALVEAGYSPEKS